jgi:hypothetical protein
MFDKNENLRSEGEKIATTQEQINEYLKCSQDILYFANNYFTIQTGTGYSIIKLREYQERILKALVAPAEDKPNSIILSARQIGNVFPMILT